MTLFEGYDMSLLFVEVNSFVHPGLESGGDFLHKVDHGGYLDI